MSSGLFELNWYAAHVRSRHEFRVRNRMAQSGMEPFLPVVEQLRKWSDRKKLVEFALFPGYIFVRLPANYEAMLSVLKLPGVVRFVGHVPGEPEVVPDEQIASLQSLVQSKLALDPYPFLKEGQRVKVVRGALKGAQGILLEKKGQHLFVVSVDILQQGVAVKIDASDLQAL